MDPVVGTAAFSTNPHAPGGRAGVPAPVEQPVSEAIAELGESAAGFALDITMDAPFTRKSLGWAPTRPGVIDSI